MSTAALTGLRDYLTGTLSPSNMLWLSTQLAEYAKNEQEYLKPMTMEEINAQLDRAEREIAAGLGQDADEVFRELEEEMERDEAEEAAMARAVEEPELAMA